LSPEKITVIYEGVNPALKPEQDAARIAQVRAQYAHDQPFIFLSARLSRAKILLRWSMQ